MIFFVACRCGFQGAEGRKEQQAKNRNWKSEIHAAPRSGCAFNRALLICHPDRSGGICFFPDFPISSFGAIFSSLALSRPR
jgi:hypothetical protein